MDPASIDLACTDTPVAHYTLLLSHRSNIFTFRDKCGSKEVLGEKGGKHSEPIVAQQNAQYSLVHSPHTNPVLNIFK